MARVFHGPTGHAPRHLPFRRAALSFMRWQARRGVLNPLDASPPGSVWWRAVNERLLRDGCETVALLGGLAGEPSSHAVRLWLEFSARPTGRNWYRAHNASIVGAYLEHRELAEAESAPERFFMNVALVRVLYAHALNAAPRLALGRLAPLGRLVGDPRLGMAGVFLSLRRVLPDRYPLALDVDRYIADEQRLGRMLDYAVIVPRLQRLYEWSADELAEPRVLGLVRDGNPIYAWPFEERHVWRPGNAVRGPRTRTLTRGHADIRVPRVICPEATRHTAPPGIETEQRAFVVSRSASVVITGSGSGCPARPVPGRRDRRQQREHAGYREHTGSGLARYASAGCPGGAEVDHVADRRRRQPGPRRAVVAPHRLQAAQTDGEVACAHGASEHLCTREPRLLPDPGPFHELRSRDEGHAEEEAAE